MSKKNENRDSDVQYQVCIRLPPDVHAAFKALASREVRTMASQAALMLSKAVAEAVKAGR